ncbi:MAG: hypothetical protein DWQ01_19800 [Planctomycetota bacterium]|nr:MAG: hypothetical protein DWQ01_19800 [Planctomycetota bacterium]
MRRSSVVLVLVAGALSLAHAGVLASSSAQELDLSALVAEAERVCEVEVLDKTCALLPDGSLETRYQFATLTPLKGAVPSFQEVRMPGGEVAGRGLYVPGLPTWQRGDRILLFLTREGKSKRWRLPVGLSAGVFQVHADSRGTRVFRRGAHAHGKAVSENHDYHQFLSEILEEVGRQGR